MPGAIAAVAAPAAPAAPAGGTPAPVQTSAGAEGTKAPGTEAAKPAETPAAKAARLRIKAKFDGKEEELDLGEDDVVRHVQKNRHFEKTRGEFEKRVQAQDAREEEILKDPLGYMRKSAASISVRWPASSRPLARPSSLR